MSKKDAKIISLSPLEYFWVKDNNLSIITAIKGPINYVLQEHEEIVDSCPKKMIIIPPMFYATIKNPVVKKNGVPQLDKDGQVKVSHSEIEYRFHEDYPFPFLLYYSEELQNKVSPLPFVEVNSALKLKGLRDVEIGGISHHAGEKWLYHGPRIYYPMPEVKISKVIKSTFINKGEALRLRAKQNFIDRTNIARSAGEEWLVRASGAYIPDVYEKIIQLQQPIIILETEALHLSALKSYTDYYGKDHRAGEEFLITAKISSNHVIDISEELVKKDSIVILSRDQYCVILNPVDSKGKNQKGAKKLVKGEVSFFLQPGESMEKGIESIMVLNENEAVLLQAKEKFKDGKENRIPGDKWMIKGPCRYIPAIEVEVIEKRSVIPLNDNEGIYVRDTKTGNIRSIIGKSYLLESHEELWSKELNQIEENILLQSNPGSGLRDKTKVVTYRCPYNSALQVYNFKTEKTRIVFGPELVMLEPDEQFCLLVLSGKTPKIPGIVKTLYLNIGPKYTTDQIEVETSDHALLVIEVAYSWNFAVDKEDSFDKKKKIFAVRDPIGEMCSILSSKVRAAVAEMTLNKFHQNSARVTRLAVMGQNSNGKINDNIIFDNNLLTISNVDIKNISTKDEATKEKLKVTVNLAIELITRSQEEQAKRQADTKDQEAKSFLQRKVIEDNSLAEDLKKKLFDLTAQTKSIEESGKKEAESKAQVSSTIISSQSNIKISTYNKDILLTKNKYKHQIEKMEHDIKLQYEKEKNNIELTAKQKISDIQTKKTQDIIDTIGRDVLIQISQAEPEAQLNLLKSLGLEGFIMTDGNSPINLFNFANKITKTNN